MSYHSSGSDPRDRRPRYRDDDRRERRRDHRPDRAWDRVGDRDYDRRDRRRDDRDQRRPSRRRERSRTPPRYSVRYREEELANVVALDKRPRKQPTKWDIKPAGYENVSSEIAKLSGLFALPGTTASVDAEKLKAVIEGEVDAEGENVDEETSAALSVLRLDSDSLQPCRSKVSKRIIVSLMADHGRDPRFTRDNMVKLFLQLIKSVDLATETPRAARTSPVATPIPFSYSTQEGRYVVLQLQRTDQATFVAALDGMLLDDNSPQGPRLKIQRPADYFSPVPADQDSSSGKVVESVNTLSISGIPLGLADEQIKEVLAAFGELKAFCAVKYRVNGENAGTAFCEYQDPDTSALACQGLDDMELGDSRLRVRMVCQGIVQPPSIALSPVAQMGPLCNKGSPHEPTTVLQLLNFVNPEELLDDKEFYDVMDRAERMCGKIAEVKDMKVPRPIPDSVGRIGTTSTQSPGVGKIYVKFASAEKCRQALEALAGKKYRDRHVITAFYPELNFDIDVFS